MTDIQRFTTSDGTGLAYRRWEPEGRTVGGPVVLHHGFAVDGRINWELPGVVARLVDAGLSVVAPDAIGHGASDTPHDPACYGEDRMAGDVSALADHLGLERFDLVGYSMGAVVALVTATQERRIRRLAVGGVGSGIVELGGVDQRHVSRDAIAAGLREPDAAAITDPAVAGFRSLADATGADRLALAAQAERARTGHLPLDRITAPTLVLAGEEDPLASRPEVLAAAIAGATLRLIPGDHLGAVMDVAFGDALLDFLTA